MRLSKKVAVIGCGHWGKNLIRNFSELKALSAVCDNDAAVAEKFSKEYHVPAMSFNEILEREIDAVVIAAPAELHYKLAHKALSANKSVYVEKPLSLAVKEAVELCELADFKEKQLMVGHLLQYHPGFLRLKELVLSGELGNVQYIYSNRLSLGKIRREENSLWSFAPHDISMILSLVGEEPSNVKASGAAYVNKNLADVTMTHLEFNNGVHAHIFVSWLHPFKQQKLVVIGSNGMIVFDDSQPRESKVQLFAHKININSEGFPIPAKADPQNILISGDEPLKIECKHFLECITLNKQPRTDGYEGLRVLKVLQAAQNSLDEERGN